MAVGFLLLDGVLFVLAGLWSGARILLVWGLLFGVAAGLVALAWRAQRRRLAAISAARRSLQSEAESLRGLAGRRPTADE